MRPKSTTLISRVCRLCGATFTITKQQAPGREGVYCSQKCFREYSKVHGRSAEWRAKLSASHTGKKVSPEHMAKMAAANIGNQYRLGIPHTLATRQHLAKTSKKADDRTRFWSKVEKTETCWLWRGSLYSNGYGRLLIGSKLDGSRREALAHRLIYEWEVGPIPPGLQVCHRCDVPNCVRPDHLFVDTAFGNAADKVAKGRQGRYDRRGKGSWSSKLTPEIVREMRQRHAEGGRTYLEIGREVGVTGANARRAILGITWGNVA